MDVERGKYGALYLGLEQNHEVRLGRLKSLPEYSVVEFSLGGVMTVKDSGYHGPKTSDKSEETEKALEEMVGEVSI